MQEYSFKTQGARLPRLPSYARWPWLLPRIAATDILRAATNETEPGLRPVRAADVADL